MSILIFVLLRKIFKPISSSNERFIDESKKAGRTLNQFTWREVQDNLLKRIKYVNMSEELREELARDIYRLGWAYSVEEVRKMQVLYTLVYVALSVMMLFVNILIGLVMLFVTFVVWNIPINQIRKEIKARDDEFISSMYGLYTIIYNQYKRKNDEHLGNIIEAYLPTAKPLMRQELMLFLRDIDSGEDYALKQLKQRIPKPIVLRFSDIILNNLEGIDNKEVMENFYIELKAERDIIRRKRNERKAMMMGWVIKSLYIPFFFLAGVYLIVSTFGNYTGNL